MSVFPMVFAENKVQFFLGLGCAGLLAIPLILIGMLLTRRAAAQIGAAGEAAASAAFLQRATSVLNALRDDSILRNMDDNAGTVGKVDPHGTFMERLRAFDLNSVTMAGWLLVLITAAFMVGGMIVGGKLLPADAGPLGALLFFGVFVLGIVFFFVAQLVLKAIGISPTKSVSPPDSPPSARS